MRENTMDMTSGDSGKLITRFAIPIMLGNVCQQLYTLVDTAVVGKVVGVEALAALGTTDWLNWMVIGILFGFTQGFSIVISQRFGAKDYENMRRIIGLSILLTAAIAVLLTTASVSSSALVLRLLQAPEEVYPLAFTYVRILYFGITTVAAYNLAGGILRALGDSQTPLVAMLIASGLNVALDLLFVAVFHWGVEGAASATILSQAVSFLYCFTVLRRMPLLQLNRGDFRWDRGTAVKLLRIGAPISLQNIIIGIGGVIVQRIVNGFGVVFVAAIAGANKLFGILELASGAFGAAVATYSGQNLGAGQYTRIRTGVRMSFKIFTLTALLVCAIMLFFGRFILSLFIASGSPQAGEVLDTAYTCLAIYCVFLPVLYWLWLYRSALQGIGDTVIPMVSGIVELFMRILAASLFPMFFGQIGICGAEVLAWIGAAALQAAVYFKHAAAFPPDVSSEQNSCSYDPT